MLYEKYILQLSLTLTLIFGKSLIICLHISYLHLQLNSQKFYIDNSFTFKCPIGHFLQHIK